MRKNISILLGFLLIYGMFTFPAFAILEGPNFTLLDSSVDNGEIRWGGNSVYLSNWNSAVNIWNPMGKVKILPDTVTTIEDLKLVDVNGEVYKYFGYMAVGSLGADPLYLNRYYLDGNSQYGSFSTANKTNTVAHELGHALGLAHNGFSNSVMKQGKLTNLVLSNQDKSSYATKWGR